MADFANLIFGSEDFDDEIKSSISQLHNIPGFNFGDVIGENVEKSEDVDSDGEDVDDADVDVDDEMDIEKKGVGEEDEEDEEEEEEEEESKAEKAIPTTKSALDLLSELDGVTELTGRLRQICSTLKSPGGAVLKFSELFAPRIAPPKKKRKLKDDYFIEEQEVEIELDETEVLSSGVDQPIITITKTEVTPIYRYSDLLFDEDEENEVEMSVTEDNIKKYNFNLDNLKESRDDMNNISLGDPSEKFQPKEVFNLDSIYLKTEMLTTKFDLVEIRSWEDMILWDASDAQSPSNIQNSSSSNPSIGITSPVNLASSFSNINILSQTTFSNPNLNFKFSSNNLNTINFGANNSNSQAIPEDDLLYSIELENLKKLKFWPPENKNFLSKTIQAPIRVRSKMNLAGGSNMHIDDDDDMTLTDSTLNAPNSLLSSGKYNFVNNNYNNNNNNNNNNNYINKLSESLPNIKKSDENQLSNKVGSSENTIFNSNNPSQPLPERHKPLYYNHEFGSGDWEQFIVWDDDKFDTDNIYANMNVKLHKNVDGITVGSVEVSKNNIEGYEKFIVNNFSSFVSLPPPEEAENKDENEKEKEKEKEKETKQFTVPLFFDINDKSMLFDETFLHSPLEKLKEFYSNIVNIKNGDSGNLENLNSFYTKEPKKPSSQNANISSPTPEKPEEVDPFNLSIDHLYLNNRATEKRQKAKKAAIYHAPVAMKLTLVKPHLCTEDLRNFHSPRATTIATTFPEKLTSIRKDRISQNKAKANNAINKPAPSRRSSREPFKKKSDLSAKEGEIILMEYIEEHPLLVMNVGMASKIVNYRRKKTASEELPEQSYSLGETVVLEPTDESPFIADIPTGKTVKSFDNNLFRVPIVRHTTNSTDFILVKSKDGKKLFIREAPPDVFIAGQLQPMVEVPAPNSRTTAIYMKARLQAFIYRYFKRKSTSQQRIRISDILAAFPGHSEAAVRKRLKDCADFQRGGDDSGWWTVKPDIQLPDEDELQKMVAPESVCAYESMLVGMHRLHEVGIERLTHPPGVSAMSISNFFASQEKNEQFKAQLKILEEELHLTTWNLTSSFVAAMTGKGMLKLTGFGSPLRKGEGFSYIRKPQKESKNRDQNNTPVAPSPGGATTPTPGNMATVPGIAAAGTTGTPSPMQPPKPLPKTAVTGTDADLRKLSMKNARKVLKEFGVPEEQIKSLSRWDCIALVRQKSGEAAAYGDESQLTKFARGTRCSIQQQQVQYKEQAQRIFEAQLRALATTETDLSSDEDEDDDEEDFDSDLEEFGKDLEDNSLSSNSLYSIIDQRKQLKDEEIIYKDLMSTHRPLNTSNSSTNLSTPNLNSSSTAIRTSSGNIARPLTASSTNLQTSSNQNANTSPAGTPSSTPPAPSKGIYIPKGIPILIASSTGVSPFALNITSIPPNKYIKRTRIISHNPDGTITRRIEIIKDPERIAEIIKQIRTAITKPKIPIKPQLSAEEEKNKNNERKERRRLQEQYRRLKKNLEKQKILKERMISEYTPESASPTSPDGTPLTPGDSTLTPLHSNSVSRLSTPQLPSPSPLTPTNKEHIISSLTPTTTPKTTKKRNRNKADPLSSDQPTPGRSSLRCGACGVDGHMKTNRSCPLFTDKDAKAVTPSKSIPTLPSPSPISSPVSLPSPSLVSSSSEGSSNPFVAIEGSKLRISSKMIQIKEEEEKAKEKLTISIPKQVIKDSQNMQSQGFDEEYTKKGKTKRGRRTKTQAQVYLNNLLEGVITMIKNDITSYEFRKPVLKKYAPDYYDIIKKPMDLSKMQERCRRSMYTNLELFLDDWRLMVSNCHDYNETRNPHLVPVVDNLFNMVKEELNKKKEEIDELLAQLNSANEIIDTPKKEPKSPKRKGKIATPKSKRPVSPRITAEMADDNPSNGDNNHTQSDQDIQIKIEVDEGNIMGDISPKYDMDMDIDSMNMNINNSSNNNNAGQMSFPNFPDFKLQ